MTMTNRLTTGRKQYVEMNGSSSGTEGKPSSSYRMAFCVELVTYSYNYNFQTEDDPIRLFLSGGAGVGKSIVTNALYEALIRYLKSIKGENPDNVKVVKTAPTGKAAFNINGNILHSAFNRYLPIEVLSIVH